MKKGRKVINFISIILLLVFIGLESVSAQTGTITYSQSVGNSYVDKKLDGQQAYCLSGATAQAPGVGFVYESQAETVRNIYYAHKIKEKIGQGIAFVEGDIAESIAVGGNFKSEYDNDVALYNSNGTITKSVGALNFQKSGANYKAEVTLSGHKFENYGTCTLTGATGNIDKTTISNGSGKITITIPQSSITDDTQVTLTCTGAVQKYSTTTTYKCLRDNEGNECSQYQDVAVEREGEKKSTVSISGNIIPEKKGSIVITKRGKNSQGTTKPLAGVKFQIKNSKGKTINATGQEEDNYVFTTGQDGKITVTDIKLSNNASENVYTIEEISTITGYVRSTQKITVTLSETNLNYTKTITNETVKVTISKTDVTGKKELPGAKLSILDKDGKILNKCVFDKEKHLITYSDDEDAGACTWASTDTSYIFEGLPKGKYYLVEELAPEGYQKSTEKILIEIKDTGAVKEKIEMKNALKVPVPDTLSARSALLLAVAMFDIALGIGIVLYVKKSKTEEQ